MDISTSSKSISTEKERQINLFFTMSIYPWKGYVCYNYYLWYDRISDWYDIDGFYFCILVNIFASFIITGQSACFLVYNTKKNICCSI